MTLGTYINWLARGVQLFEDIETSELHVQIVVNRFHNFVL